MKMIMAILRTMVSMHAKFCKQNFAESRSAVFQRYQTSIRVSAAERTEKNRRAGGRKTQKCIETSWNVSKFVVQVVISSARSKIILARNSNRLRFRKVLYEILLWTNTLSYYILIIQPIDAKEIGAERIFLARVLVP